MRKESPGYLTLRPHWAMTRFEDGPAKGQVLCLKRAPFFLRVVCAADGKWDALDQPDDEPRADETIHVYKLKGTPGFCHVNRGRNGSGWYAVATYVQTLVQPGDAVRKICDWVDWCDANADAEGFLKKK